MRSLLHLSSLKTLKVTLPFHSKIADLNVERCISIEQFHTIYTSRIYIQVRLYIDLRKEYPRMNWAKSFSSYTNTEHGTRNQNHYCQSISRTKNE